MVLLGVLWFFEHLLLARNELTDPIFLPDIEALLHETVAGEEDQHATRCNASDPRDRLSQVDDHAMTLSILVAKIEALAISSPLQDADQHLVRADDMRVLQVLLEVDLELGLERLQGSKSARCEDDGPRLQLLNLIEADACVEAKEF